MKQYIDKAEVITEIVIKMNRCKKILLDLRTQQNKDYYQGKREAYIDILSFLDTLEVKDDMDIIHPIKDVVSNDTLANSLEISRHGNSHNGNNSDLEEAVENYAATGEVLPNGKVIMDKECYICEYRGKERMGDKAVMHFSFDNPYLRLVQKPADNIEPKFHEGDWIISNNKKSIYQVVEVERGIYVIRDNVVSHEYHIGIEECERSGRLWNISDAKDGDVLAFYGEYKGNKMLQVGIIERYVGKHGGCSNTFKIYVGVNWENNLQIGEYMGCSDIRPATKEQRDTLFVKMKEAGYIWDSESKQLLSLKAEPSVEQESSWSEEDNDFMYDTISNLTELKDRYGDGYGNIGKCIEWLKSLKQRIGG